ncbi:lipoyl(octanoyl) transferase LipB [Neopusillimonas maritima]|uniref:Octanoyltransferase n=1 Tax=Neopusillimonas maritima TaxID=2026239 RepID=A0A3A1YZW7_9BURK|nr:lipoyl(octanoyl) transferase LipB [Neopusillimonas maritima]RIY42340.1 octanoyltransferase [Neopusillimonas maritima]
MINVRWLPRPASYTTVWQDMRAFTEARTSTTRDEIWLVEHEPVYTLGLAGKMEHVLNPGAIPVVKTDRGGQVTYHGPGQVVAYCLFDLRRYGLYVKEYVHRLEDVVISVLHSYGLEGACRKAGAPGVYVPIDEHTTKQLAKIAALGIKVRNGCTYHGVALNVEMDLTPFLGINPCGYEGLVTVDLAGCGVHTTVSEAGNVLARYLLQAFSAHQTT